MKYFFILMMIVRVSSAAVLPQSWVIETNQKNLAAASAKNLFDTHNYLDSVLGIQEKVLMEREDKTIGGFKLGHYETEFSVSKSGLFGLSALNATSAVEVKWKRNSGQKEEEFINKLEVMDDSPEALELTTSQLEALAVNSGKVEEGPTLKKNLGDALENIKGMMNSMEQMDFPGWRLAAVQLDISVGANGKVWLFANAGASLRIRLNWKKLKRSRVGQPLVNGMSSSSKLVNKILYDLNELYKDQDLAGFKVNMVNVGVGLSRKGGFFGIGGSKTSFIGFLRFEPVKTNVNEQKLNVSDVLAHEDIEFISDEMDSNKGMDDLPLPRKKWRAGLVKGLEMAKFFAGSAGRFKNKWQVSEIKTVFELTKSGFLGLASTTAAGVIETELVRD